MLDSTCLYQSVLYVVSTKQGLLNFFSFYISVEEFFNMSGVLAVVVLGIVMSSERTMISPEVEHFLHR